MRIARTMLAAGGALLGATTFAGAADVEFSGDVSTSCTINVTRTGVLVQNANARQLQSQGSGARLGLARVTTTGYGYTLAVEAPTSFDTEPSEDAASPETFTAQMRSGGASSFSWTASQQTLGLGNSNVRVRLTARKPTRTSFANGDYSATVVLRCE